MHESDPPKVTTVEAIAWAGFGIAAAVYAIAFIVISNLGYRDDEAVAVGWLTFAGMIAGLTFVPAIILTGIRQLVPALRSVSRGE